jgi:hypothetical protein
VNTCAAKADHDRTRILDLEVAVQQDDAGVLGTDDACQRRPGNDGLQQEQGAGVPATAYQFSDEGLPVETPTTPGQAAAM